MVAEIILCNLSDAKEVIEEARDEWIINTLLALDIPEEVIEAGYDALKRDDYIYEMNERGITIELYSNGEVNVYKQVWVNGQTDEQSGWLPPNKKHLVAQWKLPEKVKRVEGNDVYYEIRLKQWSVANVRA